MLKNFIRYNKQSGRLEVDYTIKRPQGNNWLNVEIDCNNKITVENKPCFEAVWLTDVHARLDREPYYSQRIALALESINSKPYDYVFDTGDALQGLTVPAAGTHIQQLALYDKLKKGLKKPLFNILGNHDVYGTASATAAADLGMPARYYYKDFPGNWRMIFLYSMGGLDSPSEPYSLGPTQLAWLTALIADSKDKFVCIQTHVPIISVSSPVWRYYNAPTNPIGNVWFTGRSHVDVYPLLELCRLNPNIKLVLTGHEHSYDDCLMFGTRFLCGGSLGAFYWNPENHWYYQYAGYNRLKFFPDGTFTREIVLY